MPHWEKPILSEPATVAYGNVGETEDTDFGSVRELAECDFFKVKLINLSGKTELCEEDSFVSLLVLSGNIDVGYNGEVIKAKKGDSIFIPANMKINLSGEGQVLLSRV